jgi:hypothetical protein
LEKLTLGAFLGEDHRGIQEAFLVVDLAYQVGIQAEVEHMP